jgi:hypothetical protein
MEQVAGISRKYLTETSAVPAATNASTQAHCRHYADAVRGGQQRTSVYIRMEFIARFFCELAYVAFFISQRTRVSDALILLSQRYTALSATLCHRLANSPPPSS